MKVLSDILPTGFQLPSKHSALSPKHELHRTRYLQLPLTESLLTKTTLAAHDVPCHGWSHSPGDSCHRARLGHLTISRSHVGLHVMSSSAELRGRRRSHSRAFNCCTRSRGRLSTTFGPLETTVPTSFTNLTLLQISSFFTRVQPYTVHDLVVRKGAPRYHG